MKKIVFLLLYLIISSGIANAGLLKSYDFNGSYGDTLGNGDELVASGGSILNGMYNFTNNQGLTLTSALSNTSSYAIEMRLSVNDNLSGWSKLIDFQELSTDNGFYLLNDNFNFFASGRHTLGGPVILDEFFNVAFVRSDGIITAYFNGVALTTFNDVSNQAVPSNNILTFFEDDNVTGQRESFIGAVDYIRIHDDASTFGSEPTTSVPEPSTFAIFVLGAIGLVSRRLKK